MNDPSGSLGTQQQGPGTGDGHAATDRADGKPEPAARRRPRWLVWGGIGLAVLVVGGLIGGGITAAMAGGPGQEAACKATKVADNVLPTIVTIEASKGLTGGIGSGEVIRSDGYIMTNNHVVAPAVNGGQLEVLFSNGHQVPATLTGRDPTADLAVLKVGGESSLPVIEMGSSADVVVGEPVVALGAPLGLSNTVTSGIVSATDRTIEVPGDNGQSALLASAVQTDAAINPGNSGGALVDCAGKLVGVNSAGATAPSTGGGSSTGSIGLGFAIPVDVAKRISDQIIATGHATHSYFGLQVATIPEAAAKKMGTPQGLYVAGVVPSGPAAAAGLQTGDIITEIDGKPATNANDLQAVTLTKAPGDKVELTYDRNGTTATATVVLTAAPSSGATP